jgi:5-bromo-4-chloroindolyl phosphate hydrolysis protein
VRHQAGEKAMKTVKLTRAQARVLQTLSRKDINTIRKHPEIVSAAKELLRTCKRVLRRIEAIPEYASRRKRQTAYRRIAGLCRKAIEKAEA